MRPIPAFLAAAALAVPVMPAPAAAQDFTEAEIKELALQAILENPEIVMEAVSILQARDAAAAEAAAAAALDGNRDALERDANAPVGGNPDGSVTVVEFFDYNCPYCRRAGEQVAGLLEADGDVRVVYREWPILGDGSVVAARAALAARAQGLYLPYHEALMAQAGRIDEAVAMRVAAEVGLDLDRLRADMGAPEIDAHIARSTELARGLGFSGTPSFVIGDQTAPGLVDAETMIEMVAAAREG